jgi:hypothetical protein
VATKGPVYPGFVMPPKEPSYWETDIQVIKSCGAINQKVEVAISPKAKQKISLLMKKFPKMEWLAYLVGNKATNTVEDIVIPKQRVTVVRVNVDGQVNVPIMGVIHSHHDMGNKFSHTDDEFINQNHDISLCISHNGISGHVRVKTECNRYALVEAVVVDKISEFDVTEFNKEIEAMISETPMFPGYYGKTGMGMFDDPGMADFLDEGSDLDFIPNQIQIRGMGGDLMEEIDAYEISIKDVKVDAFYQVEMSTLTNYIKSIGTSMYDYWEDKAFKGADNVYTEDYYRLIDEISACCESLSEREMVALNRLAKKLDDMIAIEYC